MFTIAETIDGDFKVMDGSRHVATIKEVGNWFNVFYPGVRGIFKANNYKDAVALAFKDSGRITGMGN